MKVFVTGASGLIGKVVVEELINAGHTVVGLARSDSSAEKLKTLGAEVHRGSLQDPSSLAEGAKSSDGVVHLAFGHDFTKMVENSIIDQTAIKAMCDAMEGTNKPFIMTGGTLMMHQGRVSTEEDEPDWNGPFGGHRGYAEKLLPIYKAKGVRLMNIRLAPINHGPGDDRFLGMLHTAAKKNGAAVYVGEGKSRGPAVHILDTARLYRLALEKGDAAATYHAIADEGVTFKELSEAIGGTLGLPAVGKPFEEAQQDIGFLAMAFSLDLPVSSKITREKLGWEPTHPSMIEDIKAGTYL